jgi:hypothetical protein
MFSEFLSFFVILSYHKKMYISQSGYMFGISSTFVFAPYKYRGLLPYNEYVITLLPTLRRLNSLLELQSIPLTQAVRISHFVCTYPCDINKSETALSFSEFLLSISVIQ